MSPPNNLFFEYIGLFGGGHVTHAGNVCRKELMFCGEVCDLSLSLSFPL